LEDRIRTPLHLVLASDWLLMEKLTFYNIIYMYTNPKRHFNVWKGCVGVWKTVEWRRLEGGNVSQHYV
jgi:hypothetical protein